MQRITFLIVFSLSSNWDVVGTNLINPRNNPEYQNQIASISNVNYNLKSNLNLIYE